MVQSRNDGRAGPGPATGSGPPTFDREDLAGRLATVESEARDRRASLRNTLLRGHGTILRDRDRSLMSSMQHSLIVDVGEALRRVLTRDADGLGAAAAAVQASLDHGWADDIHIRLAKSGSLGELDLIAALTHRMAEHAIETADSAEGARDDLPTERSGAGGALSAEAVARDPRLAKALSDYLVERSRRFDAYRNPKLPLADLAAESASRLFWAAAAAWREQMLADDGLDEADLDDVIETATAAAAAAAGASMGVIERGEAVAEALADSGSLGPGLLRGLAADGDIVMFEAVLARLLDLPVRTLRPVVFDAAGLRLAVAARASGITGEDFEAIWRVLAPAIGRIGPPAADAVPLFHRIDVDDAAHILRGWRRRPEYRAAIARLGPDG